jgi:BTB/POZ domain
VSNKKSAPDVGAKELANDSAASAMAQITRHGLGDGVITLNVGGKEFITLRSTAQMNPVLWNHVIKAELNQEFTKGAIFIDREASNFGLILQHLRNKADSVQGSHGIEKLNFLAGKTSVLFIEARYYQLKELEDFLCGYDIYTRMASMVGGGSANPFSAMSELFKTGRRMLIATGGTGLFLGAVNEDLRKKVANFYRDLKFLVGVEQEK